MIMATPFLRSLRDSLHGELWAVGKSKALHLYSGDHLFDRFIPYDDKGVIPFLDTVNLIRAGKFERGLIMPHSFRSALLFRAGNVTQRIGYDRNHRGFMLTTKVEETTRPEPTVEHYLKMIDAIGGKRTCETPALMITDDEEKRFDEKFMDMASPYVVFITGAQYGPSKRWPERHFSDLADRIVENLDMSVYLCPGFGEEEHARKIRQGSVNKDRVVIRSMDIRELKVCMSRARAVVSNDTGPRHIASALSVPCLVLLGPMDEQYTLYSSPCTRVIWKDVPCRPCNRKKCERNHGCLTTLMPDEVFHTLEEMLEVGNR